MLKALYLTILALLLVGCTMTSVTDDYIIDDNGSKVVRNIQTSSLFCAAKVPEIDKIYLEKDKIKSAGLSWLTNDHTLMGLTILGGLAVIAGIVVAVWFKQLWTGVFVGLGGVGLIMIAVLFSTYPWIVLILPVVAVGAIVYFIVEAKTKKKLVDALNGDANGTG